MKLNSLDIENFRCFKSNNIKFDSQITVIVAENGIGKTAILDAVAVALGPFLGGFDAGTSKGFKKEDARLAIRKGLHIPLEDASQRMEAQYPVSLIASGIIDGQDEQWSRELTGGKTQTTYGKAKVLSEHAEKLQKLVREGEQVALPVIAYYGTGRLWKQAKVGKKPIDSQSRIYGYKDALTSDSTYKAFTKWFTEQSLAENQVVMRNIFEDLENAKLAIKSKDTYNQNSTLPYSTELQHVRAAIDQCLAISGWSTLEYDFKWGELVVRDNELKTFIPIARLSDGVKAMLSLTADIAYRCVQLNPYLTSPAKDTNGVILIDEIDLHLHPRWQQTVLIDLQKTFPKIQFIVTTHSPQVLTTVAAKNIRILSKNGQVSIPSINTYGEESKVTLEDVQHVNSRPTLSVKQSELLKNYLLRINHGEIDSSEVIAMRTQLENDYGENYSKLKLADMVINKYKAKQFAQ